MRVRVDFHARQVTVNQRDEAREFARLKTRVWVYWLRVQLCWLAYRQLMSCRWFGARKVNLFNKYSMILCGVETAEMCRK